MPLTCDVPLPLVGALLVGVGRRRALRRVVSVQAARPGPREPVSPCAVQLGPRADGGPDDGRAGLGRPGPRLARVELPLGPLVGARALLVLSVVARVGGVRRRRHQAGAGEVRVGQEVGLLVEGERGLLVRRLQVGPRVRVPHAAPDGAAGVGAAHAAAGWLIHDGVGKKEITRPLINVLLRELAEESEPPTPHTPLPGPPLLHPPLRERERVRTVNL